MRQPDGSSLLRHLIEAVIRCSPWVAGGLAGFTRQDLEGDERFSEQLHYLQERVMTIVGITEPWE